MRLSLVVMLVAAPAFAGQLFIEHYGLADTRKEGQQIIAGTVESFAKGKEKNDFSLTVKVTRLFGTNGSYRMSSGGEPKVGLSYTCSVYDGVVWDDPGESPMDRRLRNAVGPKVEKGKTVYLVPRHGSQVELLEGTPENLTRIEVHYDDEARKKWLASADAVLESALADDELAGLAFPELIRRGTIRAGALLKADEKLARDYLLKLPAPARAAFFKDALALAKSDPQARDGLYDLACRELHSAWLADVAPLMELFPAPGSGDATYFDVLRGELDDLVARFKDKSEKQRPDLSPFVPWLVRYLLNRTNQQTDERLPELFPYLSPAAKQQLAIELINGMPKSTRSKPDDPDLSVLDVAATLVKQAPSVTVLEALGKLDPSTVRMDDTRGDTMGLMLNIGASVARGNPAARKQVQDLLEPWLRSGVGCDDAELKAWRKVMPAWKPGAPIATTFELIPGQVRRMNTGARAKLLTQEKDYGLEWTEGDDSVTTWFNPLSDDWYREVYVKPWLLTMDRVGKEAKLKVTATPAPKLTPLDDPKTHDVVEKQAAKDGCPQYEAGEYDEQKGTFTYEASGEKGRKCSYTFGIFTRTFPRKVITPTP